MYVYPIGYKQALMGLTGKVGLEIICWDRNTCKVLAWGRAQRGTKGDKETAELGLGHGQPQTTLNSHQHQEPGSQDKERFQNAKS